MLKGTCRRSITHNDTITEIICKCFDAASWYLRMLQQEQLTAADSRERELQRQVLQMQLRLEEQSRPCQAAAAQAQAAALPAATDMNQAAQDANVMGSASAVVQGLLQQRDSATAALAATQDKLAVQEAALQQLWGELQQAKQAASADVQGHHSNVAQVAAAGDESAHTHLPTSAHLGQQQQQQQVPRLVLTRSSAVGPPDIEVSGMSTVDLDLGASLSWSVDKLTLTQRGGTPAWHRGAAGSSSSSRPLSASADSAVWAAMKAGGGAGGPLSDVASRAAQLVAGLGSQPQDPQASLRSSLEEVHLARRGGTAAAAAGSVEEEEEVRQLRTQQAQLSGALVAAEATNERLRSIIAALRKEMEDLQSPSECHNDPPAGDRQHTSRTVGACWFVPPSSCLKDAQVLLWDCWCYCHETKKSAAAVPLRSLRLMLVLTMVLLDMQEGWQQQQQQQ
jgi:hypothetical protein